MSVYEQGPVYQYSTEHLKGFGRLLLFGAYVDFRSFLDGFIASGVSSRELYLGVVAPCARWLGELWERNEVSISDILAASSRLDDLVRKRELGNPNVIIKSGPRSALLATVPGEAHTLGVGVAAGLLRDEGWNIDLLMPTESPMEIVSMLDRLRTKILGVSVSSSSSVHSLYTLVKAVREYAPETKVLVSGSLVSVNPKPFEMLGLDGFETDFDKAKSIIEGFSSQ